jgi:hypothetical protein
MVSSLRDKLAAAVDEATSASKLAFLMLVTVGALAAPAAASAAPSFDYTATAPPDTGKVDTVLGYCAWGVLLLCVLGVFGAIAKMVSAHHTGRSAAEYVPALFVCGAGAILSGAAGSLITGLL